MNLSRRQFFKATAGAVTLASASPARAQAPVATSGSGPDFSKVRADFPWIQRTV